MGRTTIGGKAAQRFTLPRGALRSQERITWYCKPGTCYAGYIKSGTVYTETNGKGWFAPNNPTGPSGPATHQMPTNTTTFPYFRWSHYTPGGGPAPYATYRERGNYRMPPWADASLRAWPGPHRFGGTMRWLYGPGGLRIRSFTWNTPGLSRALFPATQWQRASLEPFSFGQRVSGGYGYRLRYTSQGVVPGTWNGDPIAFRIQYITTGGPRTTGKVRAYHQTYSITTLTFEGYDNRSWQENCPPEGRLSMVRPRLRHS